MTTVRIIFDIHIDDSVYADLTEEVLVARLRDGFEEDIRDLIEEPEEHTYGRFAIEDAQGNVLYEQESDDYRTAEEAKE